MLDPTAATLMKDDPLPADMDEDDESDPEPVKDFNIINFIKPEPRTTPCSSSVHSAASLEALSPASARTYHPTPSPRLLSHLTSPGMGGGGGGLGGSVMTTANGATSGTSLGQNAGGFGFSVPSLLAPIQSPIHSPIVDPPLLSPLHSPPPPLVQQAVEPKPVDVQKHNGYRNELPAAVTALTSPPMSHRGGGRGSSSSGRRRSDSETDEEKLPLATSSVKASYKKHRSRPHHPPPPPVPSKRKRKRESEPKPSMTSDLVITDSGSDESLSSPSPSRRVHKKPLQQQQAPGHHQHHLPGTRANSSSPMKSHRSPRKSATGSSGAKSMPSSSRRSNSSGSNSRISIPITGVAAKSPQLSESEEEDDPPVEKKPSQNGGKKAALLVMFGNKGKGAGKGKGGKGKQGGINFIVGGESERRERVGGSISPPSSPGLHTSGYDDIHDSGGGGGKRGGIVTSLNIATKNIKTEPQPLTTSPRVPKLDSPSRFSPTDDSGKDDDLETLVGGSRRRGRSSMVMVPSVPTPTSPGTTADDSFQSSLPPAVITWKSNGRPSLLCTIPLSRVTRTFCGTNMVPPAANSRAAVVRGQGHPKAKDKRKDRWITKKSDTHPLPATGVVGVGDGGRGGSAAATTPDDSSFLQLTAADLSSTQVTATPLKKTSERGNSHSERTIDSLVHSPRPDLPQRPASARGSRGPPHHPNNLPSSTDEKSRICGELGVMAQHRGGAPVSDWCTSSNPSSSSASSGSHRKRSATPTTNIAVVHPSQFSPSPLSGSVGAGGEMTAAPLSLPLSSDYERKRRDRESSPAYHHDHPSAKRARPSDRDDGELDEEDEDMMHSAYSASLPSSMPPAHPTYLPSNGAVGNISLMPPPRGYSYAMRRQMELLDYEVEQNVENEAQTNEAKRIKHEADNEANLEAKCSKYLKAFTMFILTAYKSEKDGQLGNAFNHYDQILRLIKCVMKRVIPKTKASSSPKEIPDARLVVMSLRLQALLNLKMYKLKKHEHKELQRTISDILSKEKDKDEDSNSQVLNPQVDQPHISPTPSPAGSEGSNCSKSSGYTSSGEGRIPGVAAPLTTVPPVCLNIPRSTLYKQYTIANYLSQCHELWDQADNFAIKYSVEEFFQRLDEECHPLSLHSAINHLLVYTRRGLDYISQGYSSNHRSPSNLPTTS